MRFYNTLTKQTQEFKATRKFFGLSAPEAKMYHCGPTVYNFAHIGNMRSYVFADTIRRGLEFIGYKTKQVINITDVGHLTDDGDLGRDRIEDMAAGQNKTTEEIVDFYSKAFFDDLKRLNINTQGTIFPRASKHIAEQISLIKKLEKKGVTYKTSDGIYFDTSLFKEYGKLGSVNIKNLEEGARVAKNPEKKNPTDFALWKFSPDKNSGEKRQQEWPSPWGIGFPGWHIECSAMAMKYLGESFDIHTGGIDHIPVHHNNEIAQSECATGQPFARFWLHNEFVNTQEAKMSKSKGNFIRLSTLEEDQIHPLAYRYWLLTAHYRTPVSFSFEAVLGAQTALESVVRKIRAGLANQKNPNNDSENYKEIIENIKKLVEDDLNTPEIISLLHKIADQISEGKIGSNIGRKIIKIFDQVLGLRLLDLVYYTNDVQEDIKKLLNERELARSNRDWAKSDSLRKDLENKGYIVEDRQDSAKVRRSLPSLIGII